MDIAQGAWLAEPIVADSDIPPADRAAMDGYALRFADLSDGAGRLVVDGEIAAGSAGSHTLLPGRCFRIFTGANLPPGADTVVAVEHTSTRSFAECSSEPEVEILPPTKEGANIFRRGENARAGAVLLNSGKRLGPRQIGVAAATGYAAVNVYRRPRVRILNTGAELLEAGDRAAPHLTRNSNGPMLQAALREAGFAVAECAKIPDTLKATADAIEQAMAQADAVVVTGGISAGRFDHVPQALRTLGAEILYRGIAVKPGKPQLFARGKDGCPVFGLPGNPLSSIVGAYELVIPGLCLLAGCPDEDCRPSLFLPLSEPAENSGDRTLVVPARIRSNPSGIRVSLQAPVGSADLVTSAKVDGAVLLPVGAGRLEAGTMVEFRRWGGPLW